MKKVESLYQTDKTSTVFFANFTQVFQAEMVFDDLPVLVFIQKF